MGQFKGDDLAGFWLKATVTAGVPTNAASFNVTSITDTGPWDSHGHDRDRLRIGELVLPLRR